MDKEKGLGALLIFRPPHPHHISTAKHRPVRDPYQPTVRRDALPSYTGEGGGGLRHLLKPAFPSPHACCNPPGHARTAHYQGLCRPCTRDGEAGANAAECKPDHITLSLCSLPSQGCYRPVKDHKVLNVLRHSLVVVVCDWDVPFGGTSSGRIGADVPATESRAQLLRALRTLGYTVDHLLTRDAPGCPQDGDGQEFLHW